MVSNATAQKESRKQSLPKVSSDVAIQGCSLK